MSHTTRIRRGHHASLVGRLAQRFDLFGLMAMTATLMTGNRETSGIGAATVVVGPRSSSEPAPELSSAVLSSLRLAVALDTGGGGTGCRTVVLTSGISTVDPLPVEMLCLDTGPSDELMRSVRLTSTLLGSSGEADGRRSGMSGDGLSTRHELRRRGLPLGALTALTVADMLSLLVTTIMMVTAGRANRPSARLGVRSRPTAGWGLSRSALGLPAWMPALPALARQESTSAHPELARSVGSGGTRGLPDSPRWTDRRTALGTSVRAAPARSERSWRSPASTVTALPLAVTASAIVTPALVAA